MRVLCTVLGSVGHANAVLPITRALVAAGHEVLYATTRELSSRFADEEGEVVAVLPGAMEQLAPLLQYLRTGAGMSREVATQFGDPAFDMAWTATGEHLITSFQALLPIAKEFGPDLVLRDGPEYAGCLVAEALGVPHVSAPSGDGNILDPLRVIGPLNERRAAVGLPEQADPLAIYRHGRIDCVPASCSFAAFPIPDAVAYQQPAAGAAQQQSLPREIGELSADRPLVLVTVGSEFQDAKELIDTGGPQLAKGMSDPADTVRALVAAMAELDCHAVVSTGGLDVPDLAPADNVLVYPWIPQSVLLRCAQLFVTHGGYNSIRESLLTGTPMVVLPQYGDNIANARRVGELGVGVGLSDGPARVEAIVAACRQVLSEPAFTARTRQAQRAMLALPGVGTVVTHLESLASV